MTDGLFSGRHRFLGVRFFFYIALSIGLIFLDHQQHHLNRLRSTLSLLVIPVQYAVNFPNQLMNWVQLNLTSREALIEENMTLRAELILLKAQVQKYEALEQENSELRALLRSASKKNERMVAAQIIAVEPDPNVQQVVILDKGSRQQIFVGQPVIDANGVMGQVIEAGPLTSRVLLLTDNRSAIPVKNTRNGLRGLMKGTGSMDTLELAHVSKTADVQQGDIFVTSGLDQQFPEGYPVGKVARVSHAGSDAFATVTVIPTAHPHQSRLVLLVWPQPPAVAAAMLLQSTARTRG